MNFKEVQPKFSQLPLPEGVIFLSPGFGTHYFSQVAGLWTSKFQMYNFFLLVPKLSVLPLVYICLSRFPLADRPCLRIICRPQTAPNLCESCRNLMWASSSMWLLPVSPAGSANQMLLVSAALPDSPPGLWLAALQPSSTLTMAS